MFGAAASSRAARAIQKSGERGSAARSAATARGAAKERTNNVIRNGGRIGWILSWVDSGSREFPDIIGRDQRGDAVHGQDARATSRRASSLRARGGVGIMGRGNFELRKQ